MKRKPSLHTESEKRRKQELAEQKRQEMAERRKQRSKYYHTTSWRKIRKKVLAEKPLCQICLKIFRRLTVATICDHIEPWETGEEFFAGPFQGLCKSCHREKLSEDMAKRRRKEKLKPIFF